MNITITPEILSLAIFIVSALLIAVDIARKPKQPPPPSVTCEDLSKNTQALDDAGVYGQKVTNIRVVR